VDLSATALSNGFARALGENRGPVSGATSVRWTNETHKPRRPAGRPHVAPRWRTSRSCALGEQPRHPCGPPTWANGADRVYRGLVTGDRAVRHAFPLSKTHRGRQGRQEDRRPATQGWRSSRSTPRSRKPGRRPQEETARELANTTNNRQFPGGQHGILASLSGSA